MFKRLSRGSFEARFATSPNLRHWRDKQVSRCLAHEDPTHGLVLLSERLFRKLPASAEQEVRVGYDTRVRRIIDDPRTPFSDLPDSMRAYAVTAIASYLLSRRYALRYGPPLSYSNAQFTAFNPGKEGISRLPH